MLVKFFVDFGPFLPISSTLLTHTLEERKVSNVQNLQIFLSLRRVACFVSSHISTVHELHSFLLSTLLFLLSALKLSFTNGLVFPQGKVYT